jgi:hypothetical protein
MKRTSIFNYYRREIKTLSLVLFLVAAVIAFFRYRLVIAANLFSEKGMMILLGLAIGCVAGGAIRVYYQVIVIKYSMRKF